MTRAEREGAWPAWVSRHDSTIRARLEGGDRGIGRQLPAFGTTFTELARATERDRTTRRPAEHDADSIIQRRIEDLIAGIASRGTDERLSKGEGADSGSKHDDYRISGDRVVHEVLHRAPGKRIVQLQMVGVAA
jgi:hypothetical protein